MTNLNITTVNLLDNLLQYGRATAVGPRQIEAALKLEGMKFANVERNTTHGAEVLLLTLRLGDTALLTLTR